MINKDFALKLANVNKESEVINLFKEIDKWDSEKDWNYYGNRENNFGEIGNQQSEPAAALVEKLTNAIDANLMAKVLADNINPEGSNAPNNIDEVLEEYFNIKSGNLVNLSPYERTELSKNIALVASGYKTNPSYSIIDKGEGQSPASIPKTILSLGESNKLRIPFVQGKFNMGGTGAFQFCGKNNLQLVISKRHPEISQHEDDETSDKWGVTLVKRVNPKDGMVNSTFKYFAPDGKIMSFRAESLPLWPDEFPNEQGNPMKWGTFIKLYEYDMTGLKTNILFDLNYKLSLLLPKTALPIRLYERRNYKGHSLETTLSGLNVRLKEDKSNNLVEGFPTFHEINILKQKLKIHVYAFKKNKEKNYKNNEGVLFTINGQTHGYLDDRFFGRKNVGMDYIRKSILVIVDCSDINGRIREDTFMNSRDRLRESEFKSAIEKELEKQINNHPGLKELREERKKSAVREKTEDNQKFKNALENILKQSPTFSEIFISGKKLSNPFNLKKEKVDKFDGKEFPTFFELEKRYNYNNPKPWHINERCRIKFKTDVENNFFGRDKDPGVFKLYLNDKVFEYYSLNLWNGYATLNIEVPDNAKIGDIIYCETEVIDLSKVEPFKNNFYLEIKHKRNNKGGNPGKRKSLNNKNGDTNNEETPSGIDLPSITEINKEKWSDYEFNKNSALDIIYNGESYDFFINMDNIHLLTEKKSKSDIESDILDYQYKYGMALIGMALIKDLGDQDNLREQIRTTTKSVSPVLLPMIEALGSME